MIKFIQDITKIKESNLVYLVENKADIRNLDFLKLDKKIIKKIEDTIKTKKSSFLEFFL
jgi:hypothetical protein